MTRPGVDPPGDGAEDRQGDDMALAFSLEAAERLADPAAAFEDARRWTTHLGIISRRPRAASTFAGEHGLAQDFFTGDRGIGESLALVRQQVRAERYVYVGVGESDRSVAESVDWEYRPIEAAAEKADWELESPDDDRFVFLSRLFDMLRR